MRVRCKKSLAKLKIQVKLSTHQTAAPCASMQYLCVCVVCVCVCVCVCVHAFAYTHSHACLCMLVHVCACVHVRVTWAYACAYVHSRARVCVCVCRRAHAHRIDSRRRQNDFRHECFLNKSSCWKHFFLYNFLPPLMYQLQPVTYA